MSKNDPTCVRRVDGQTEAQEVKMLLRAHGIPADLRGEASSSFAFTVGRMGIVEIHVPPEHVEAARTILARADSGELASAVEAGQDEPDEEG